MRSYSYSPKSTYSQRNSAYRPRSLRRSESKARNKLLATIIISGLIIVVFLFWGLPTLVGSLSFLNRSKTPTQSSSEDPAIAPPVLNIPYEATNSAKIQINGYSNANSKIEIYVDDDLKSSIKTDADGKFTSDFIDLSLGKNNIYGKTVDDGGKKSLPSKTIVLVYSNQKPKLDLSSPPDGQQIKGGDKKIVISGSTDPLDSIIINGTAAVVDNQGNFSATITINDGDNTVTITATDQFGNTNQVVRKVTYSAS